MSDDALPSPAQVRAGRALLGWSQQTLADAAGASRRAVLMVEDGTGGARTGRAVRDALVGAGVVFLHPGDRAAAGGAGVRLRN